MNDEPKDGGQAFPRPVTVGPNDDVYPAYPGMSLLDYFAAHAPWGRASFLGDPEDGAIERVAAHMAKKAYAFADAMLAERQKGGA